MSRRSAATIGPNALVDATAQVAPTAIIGPNAFIGPNAVVGEGAIIDGGAHIGDGAIIGAAVRIGADATVHPGIRVEPRVVVRPGAVVTRPVPATAIVEGNPAAVIDYVDAEQRPAELVGTSREPVERTSVRGVTIHHFPVISDPRGSLSVGEFERNIPFVPLRYFMVFNVPSREARGEHAHRECHQFLICVRGSCSIIADDGQRRVEIVLDTPSRGLYLPPMVWGIQYRFSADAVLLVFASHYYDPADYIRVYPEFKDAVARGGV